MDPDEIRSARIQLAACFAVLVGVGALMFSGADVSCSFGGSEPAQAGKPVPNFQTTLDDGTALSAADLQGHVTLMTFWATWCGPCRQELPSIDALYDEHEQLWVYGVNLDRGALETRRPQVIAMTRELGVGFPQVYDDGSVGRAFGVSGIPHLVLVDGEGVIRHQHIGLVPESMLRREVEALLEERN
ncbi:cytochrome c biogenesis [Plesiocystis pacifica SIR-1]|uniref:Cytochrome c biogenesis n=1 Tax=Plesiocystis pacifica SIR-1 TaxID=391625 RepID=A6FY68_9BACT|nr:TlpA disulfide reductase family protein [Plesiocystis pacifica]EDM81447.1 cytochrome c biogenesis [Plesiocystis pacifica SIR-1]